MTAGRILLRVVVGLTLFALVLWFADPLRVLHALGRPDPRWLGTGFAASLIATLLSALRWHALAGWLGMSSRRLTLMVAYFRGITANTVLPGGHLGGDALRALHLQQAGHPLGKAAVSVALDRVSGLWMLTVICLVTAATAVATGTLPETLLHAPAALLALLAVLVLASPLLAWQISAAARGRLPAKLRRMLDTLHGQAHPIAQYFAQGAWSGGVQLCSMAAFACGGYAVGLDLPDWLYFIAAGPIFILAAVPVSIGGWGTREAAAAVILGLFGAPRDLAVAASVIYGLFAVTQGLLGSLSLLHSMHNRQQ